MANLPAGIIGGYKFYRFCRFMKLTGINFSNFELALSLIHTCLARGRTDLGCLKN